MRLVCPLSLEEAEVQYVIHSLVTWPVQIYFKSKDASGKAQPMNGWMHEDVRL